MKNERRIENVASLLYMDHVTSVNINCNIDYIKNKLTLKCILFDNVIIKEIEYSDNIDDEEYIKLIGEVALFESICEETYGIILKLNERFGVKYE